MDYYVKPEAYKYMNLKQYVIPEGKKPNCYQPKNQHEGFRIPKVSHHIWIAGSNDRLPVTETLQFFKQKITQMNDRAMEVPWKHVLWTNSDELANKLQNEFAELNIEIRNIYSPEFRLSNLASVTKLLSVQRISQVGAAVDVLKYDIVNTHGGIVMDLNYELLVDPDEFLKNNDFLLQNDYETVENFMIGSKPGHPVLENILKFSQQMIEIGREIESETYTIVTYHTFKVFNFVYSQIDNNCDVALPSKRELEDISANVCADKSVIREFCCTDESILNDESAYKILTSNFLFPYYLSCHSEPLPELYQNLFGRDGADGLHRSWDHL